MAGVIDRLIGSDGSLYTASFGTALATGTATSGSWYKIATVSGVATFPAGYEVGDLVLGNGQTFNAGNTAALATFTSVADCTSFSFDVSADEVEVTVLGDSVKKFRKGKSDFSGTIEGINFISEMRKASSFINRFIRTVVATSANVATLQPKSTAALYGKFFLNDSTASGETQVFLFGQIEIFGAKLGAAVGDVQSYSSGVRFTGDADPMLYFLDNA